MISPSRPSPAFRTASDKSWAWRPGNEATKYSVNHTGFAQIFEKSLLAHSKYTLYSELQTTKAHTLRVLEPIVNNPCNCHSHGKSCWKWHLLSRLTGVARFLKDTTLQGTWGFKCHRTQTRVLSNAYTHTTHYLLHIAYILYTNYQQLQFPSIWL